jgi:hypothetical protein
MKTTTLTAVAIAVLVAAGAAIFGTKAVSSTCGAAATH